ncbi:MAG: aldehyde dehydrogenase family protein [Candidatus Omnitrophica bacterium]|nr:aldehyde dehydrogenase family protein [Candidatus Omnitrophota bacterium]
MKAIELRQYELFIDGKLVSAQKYFDAINPSNGEVFAKIADASVEDMHKAIAAARRAFDHGPWKDFSFAQRGIYLKKMAKKIRDHAKELAELETLSVGKTSKHANFIDVPTAIETFEYFSDVNLEGLTRINPVDAPVKSLTKKEPLGVIGSLFAYNYPIIYSAWKLAPALMTGNCVILKPSPKACASVMRLAQLLADCDLPNGVINIVSTQDNKTAMALVSHPDVNMISFTGGNKTGQLIMQEAAKTTKKISLELGGKSPNIVFADCEMEAALGGTLSSIFINQGQMCTAGSRLFVEESIYEPFVKRLVERARSLKIGDASDYTTEFGPMTSKEQRDAVLTHINEAVKDGAKIACGGKIPTEVSSKGYYIEPTILTNVNNSMAIVRDEVFGPVLCIFKFIDEKNVIQMANDSIFGLAASVWTKDPAKAERVTNQLQVGTVWINTYGGFYNQAPFGGYKQSGFGRELGPEGMLEYMQTKHVCIDQTPGGMPLAASWF